MKLQHLLPVILGAMVAAPAFANPDLAQKKNCMACHQVDKKAIGPSFKDIAAKYAGDKEAAGKLATKVIKGSGGVWGGPMAAMPANPQVSEAEAKQLVDWVLSQK